MGKVLTGSAAWMRAQDAPDRVGRSRRTVYRWIAEGKVRSWRPGRDLMVHVGDLLDVEKATIRRVGGK